MVVYVQSAGPAGPICKLTAWPHRRLQWPALYGKPLQECIHGMIVSRLYHLGPYVRAQHTRAALRSALRPAEALASLSLASFLVWAGCRIVVGLTSWRVEHLPVDQAVWLRFWTAMVGTAFT